MNDQEAKAHFLQAISEQLESIAVVNRQILRHRQASSDLELRQYQHLRKEYLEQLAELMERLPDSMRLDVVEHI